MDKTLDESSLEDLLDGLTTEDYRSYDDIVTADHSDQVTVRKTVMNYFDALRPFWWLYLALLVLLSVMIFYVKKDVILDRCRRKDPREHMTRLDVSACNIEVLVTCRPPPSYDQAMGLSPQEPPPHELPPKHPPLPEDEVKAADTFNVWFG